MLAGPPLLLAVDGNSLLHRAYHSAATGEHVDADGRGVWAVRGLIGFVARAAARLRPDGLLIGFDCADSSTRKAEFPGYKAHRPPKPAELVEQLAAAPQILRTAALSVVVPPGYEADDVLASAAATARTAGWRCTVMTSDRDAFALIDETTSVLRIGNGGMDRATLLTAVSMPAVCGVEAWQYPDLAALRGDPSDNLPGIPGFGTTTAARLLAAFGSIDAALAATAAGRAEELRAAVGDRAADHFAAPTTRDTLDRNRRLMRMRTDLPLPALDSVRLPVDFGLMRRALADRGIILGRSLWSLTGGDPLPLNDVAEAAGHRTRARTASSRKAPVRDQLALF